MRPTRIIRFSLRWLALLAAGYAFLVILRPRLGLGRAANGLQQPNVNHAWGSSVHRFLDDPPVLPSYGRALPFSPEIGDLR